LLDIQQGSRDGAEVQAMRAAVSRLSMDDIVAISAYAASRMP
jgi:hypothetical protein